MAITAEQLMVEVRADVRQALSELNRLDRTQNTLSSNVSRYAKRMAVAFGFTTAAAGIGKVVSLAMDFDKTMRTVGVQTDTTGAKLSAMSDLAKQMGADTVFSAQDAAQSMLELAKGGLTAAQIKAGALQSTLTLAAAGGLDLASAAGYVTQGMNTFGLAAKDANQVVTALAGGANASTADVSDLGMALSQVGPGAKNAGMSIQETVAALSAFASAGIQGSDAGTSFKTFLTQLVPTTKKAKDAMAAYNLDFVDAHGNFKSLADISQNLQDRLGGLSEAQQTAALKTLFGSDATRAATVLMGQGAKGVQKYIRATKDQQKAQDMANVTMQGASGAWENFKGSAETAAISLGQKALPAVTDLLNVGTGLINDAPQWGKSVQESFGWMVDAGEDLLGALKSVAGVVGDLAGFFDSLPGPVKEVGVQAAIAALVLPRLTTSVTGATGAIRGQIVALQQWRAEMSYAETRTGATSAALGKLSGAAKAAAGVGGMVALTQATQESNDAVAGLETTLGGAAVGFSMGGPIGAGIGGLGGLMLTLMQNTDRAGDAGQNAYRKLSDLNAVDQAKKSLDDLRSTLDQVTGAYTGATRAAVLQKLQTTGLLDVANKYGISSRAVVNAALGQKGAMGQLGPVIADLQGQMKSLDDQQTDLARNPNNFTDTGFTKAAQDQYNALEKQKQTLATNLQELRQFPSALKTMGAETRAAGAATADYTGKLKGIPKNVRSNIQAAGIDASVKGVATYAHQIKGVDRKQIKTLFQAAGIDPTVKQIDRVQTAMKNVNKIKPNTKSWSSGILAGVTDAVKFAARGGKATQEALEKPLKAAKANLRPYISSVQGGGDTAKGVALTEGVGVGSNLKSGVISGFSGTQAQLVAAAVAAVHAAVAAAKAAARSKSPSREMAEKVGQPLGEGIGVGIMERTDDAKKKAAKAVEETAKAAKEKAKRERERMKDAGKSLMDSLMESIRAGGGEWEKQFKRMKNWAEKALSGKAQRTFVAEVKKANRDLKGLYAERSALESQLASAQDELQRRQDEKASFVSEATAGMAGQATVVGIGSNAATIKQQLAKRLANVKEFAGLLGTLKGQGWPTAIIREIAAAGVDSGLQAARALASASAEDRAAITGSYQEIQAIGQQTAAALGSSMYDAGITSQQGLVDGLKAKDKAVNDQIAAIGRAIAKKLKHDLKQAGRDAGQSVADGMKDDDIVDAVFTAAKALGAAAKRGVREGMGKAATGGAGGSTSKMANGDYSNAPSLPPAAAGAVSFTFVTHNPVAEPNSVTQNKALQKVAILGLNK